MYNLKIKNMRELILVVDEIRHYLKEDFTIDFRYMGTLFKYQDGTKVVSDFVCIPIKYTEEVRVGCRRSNVKFSGYNKDKVEEFLEGKKTIGNYFGNLNTILDELDSVIIDGISKKGKQVSIPCLEDERRLDYKKFLAWVCEIHNTQTLFIKFKNSKRALYTVYSDGVSIRKAKNDKDTKKSLNVYVNTLEFLAELIPESHMENIFYGNSVLSTDEIIKSCREIGEKSGYSFSHISR